MLLLKYTRFYPKCSLPISLIFTNVFLASLWILSQIFPNPPISKSNVFCMLPYHFVCTTIVHLVSLTLWYSQVYIRYLPVACELSNDSSESLKMPCTHAINIVSVVLCHFPFSEQVQKVPWWSSYDSSLWVSRSLSG